MTNPQNEEKDQKQAQVTIKYSKEAFYEGEVLEMNGKQVKHGKGKMSFQSYFYSICYEEVYEGEWKNDCKNGFGVYKYINGAIYEGEWKNDYQDGFGIYLYADGSYYEGIWKEHKMHGEGIYVDIKGRKWKGIFQNGCFDSNKQVLLKLEVIKTEKMLFYKAKINSFFELCSTIIEKDKKGIKDFMKKRLFVEICPDLSNILNDRLIKFEDKKSEVWFINKVEDF